MSQQNVESIRRVYAAFNRRDADEAVELVAPEFSFKSEFDALFGRRYEGRSGFRQYFHDMADVWAAFHIEAEEFESLGDVVIVAYRESAVGRSSGVEVEARGYEVWHFEHGCPISNDNYPTREQALEAAGLAE
jgi:ketosteroid isomerase-like protein